MELIQMEVMKEIVPKDGLNAEVMACILRKHF